MTREEAHLILLEAALDGAVNLIEFLHGCLMSDFYSYEYPEQTMALVTSARRLAPARPGCVHGRRNPECEACVFQVAEVGRQAEARAVLGDDVP